MAATAIPVNMSKEKLIVFDTTLRDGEQASVMVLLAPPFISIDPPEYSISRQV